MGLLVDSCDHTTIQDLTIYHAGSFAVFQTNGSNNTFKCGSPPAYPFVQRGHLSMSPSRADMRIGMVPLDSV